MTVYKAPLRDFRFVLDELLDVSALAKLPGYEEATPEIFAAVLEEGGKLCEEVLFPLNRSGDEEGCIYENGVVRTPTGFKAAYQTFREGGWTALGCDPAYGGQGLPHTLNICVEEMICSANMSFGMYPGLSGGAYRALAMHGSDALKKRFLPHLVDGTWSGTMCLTEPQCGTDLGLIRTRAEPTGSGAYAITGAKIFISAGEHDLTDNILHLVLARLPDAPAGIRGISLFLVPKFLVGESSELGPRNGVRCGSIEHKMGIKASSTCVMNFDAAEGYLVGQPHAGMRAMFTMMNAARLDVAEKHPDAAEREAAEDLVALMTPVLKSALTDGGFDAANLGVQIMGGHGYIRENGMEQLVRDARIAQIYEGANGIQALDLVGRKLPMHMGRLLRRFFHPVDRFIAEHKDVAELQEFVLPLAKAFGKLQQATVLIAQRGMANPDEAGAAASDYLKLFALTSFAFMWARAAKVALPKVTGDEAWFYKGKLATARFFMSRILPQTSSLLTIISAGAKPLMALEAEAF